jgi:hypothetical protein
MKNRLQPFLLIALILLGAYTLYLFKSLRSEVAETDEYANGDWVLMENIHVSDLRDSVVRFYSLEQPSKCDTVDGWQIDRSAPK